MSSKVAHIQPITHLKEISSFFEDADPGLGKSGIKVYDRKDNSCRKNLKPNRREFYQIIYFEKGDGFLTLGLDTYRINEPTVAFIHPNEIISWENTGDESLGHICLFTKDFLEDQNLLKPVIDKYGLFADVSKSVIRLQPEESAELNGLFMKMHREEADPGKQSGDIFQAYIQLIMLTATKRAQYPATIPANNEYRHVYDFFKLLEKETIGINYDSPVRLKTAQEYADELSVHPNHLNALLKRYTGENVSSHIKKRLLEESKVLLIQTNWTLQNIGYAVGFTAQPSFSQFFKKNLGITPADYRRNFTADVHHIAMH